MQNNTLRNIIILLIILVIGTGVFFGYTFYTASKKTQTSTTKTVNQKQNTTPFQRKTGSSTDILIKENGVDKKEVENPTNTTFSGPVTQPRLVQLWKEPVSGFDFINKDVEVLATTTSSSTFTNTFAKKPVFKNQSFIYFWDRATGNIYQNLASTTKVDRLSNQTHTQSQEVFFLNSESILARKLDANNETVQTTYINLFKETATSSEYSSKKKVVYLNSDHISVSKEDKKIFFFVKKTGQAILSNFDLSAISRVLSTSITELVPQYVNTKVLAATTKASAYFQGYLFFINPNGSNQYILGDKYGFTTLVSPDGKKVLYSEIENDILQTSIYDLATKKVVALTQSTLSEKCAWSTDSSRLYCAIPQKLALKPYPDAWYQGLTDFTDNIWSVDANTGVFRIVIPLQDQVTEPVDAYNIKVSADKKHLLFQDKYTLTLWKYDL